MWSLRSLSLFVILLLSACGFHAMYGDAATQASNTPLQGNLIIEPIGGRTGQILRSSLEDRFNPEGIKFAAPDYHLQIGLTESSIPAVVKSDGTIQRYEVRIYSTFKLLKNGNTKPVLTGDLRRISTYNTANDANFATYEGEQDAIQRMLKEMAEDYVLRMSGYFAGQN